MAEPQRSRPFTLRDALALVAATALGFALTRSLSGFHAISRFDIVASGDRDTINTQPVVAGVNFVYSQASKAPSISPNPPDGGQECSRIPTGRRNDASLAEHMLEIICVIADNCWVAGCV
jgi:hypothetical protein